MALSRFNKLVHEGLGELKRRLPERWVGERDAGAIADEIDDLGFPAAVAFLGARETPRDGAHREFAEKVARRVAGDEQLKDSGVEQRHVEAAIGELLRDGVPAERALGRLGRDAGWRERVFDGVVAALVAEAGLPSLAPGQAHEIAEILKTGEFYEDFGAASAAIGALLGRAPKAAASDAPAPVREAPATALEMWDDLMEDGKLDKTRLKPRLQEFYAKESPRTVAEMTRSLIGPENRSVRYAIIIYARANGVLLRESDLDLLHDTVFAGEAPDLGALLVEAYDRFVSGLGNYAFRDALKRMRSRRL